MADVVADLGANYANLRYRHPFVTEGLNKKVVGMPSGILQGGKLTAAVGNQSVVVNTDPDTGLSVYNYERRSSPLSAVTVIEDENRTIDLSAQAGTTVYVCLYVEYTITTTTLVQFRTYSEAELFGASPVTEAEDVVILGKVDVPATAIPIPDEDVVGDQRTDAWQRRSAGSRDWLQLATNGSAALPVTPSGGATDDFLFYKVDVTGDAGLIHSTTYSRSMAHSLRVHADGPAAITFGPASYDAAAVYTYILHPIKAGQRVMYSFYKRAVAWVPAFSPYIRVAFKASPIVGSATTVDKTFECSGTDSDWVHVTGVVEVAADGWFYWSFALGSTYAGLSYVFIDDLRVWVEPGKALEDEGFSALRGLNAPVVGSSLVLPPAIWPTALSDWSDAAVKLTNITPTGGTPATLSITSDNALQVNAEADLYLSGDLYLVGSATQFEYDSARTVTKIIHPCSFMPNVAYSTQLPDWVTVSGGWQSATDFGGIRIPLALPIESLASSSITVEVLVSPGAARTGTDRMAVTTLQQELDWTTPAPGGDTFVDTVYSDTTTNTQIITVVSSFTVNAARSFAVVVSSGNDGSTNEDVLYGCRVTYSLQRVPRAYCSI